MSNYLWRVHVAVRSGFNPVSILWYATQTYQDAFDYLDTRAHLINKKRSIFVKQAGTKHKHFHFDERFNAALLAEAELDPDEYYEEGTADDRASAQIHQPDKRHPVTRVIWRGLAGSRSVPNPVGSDDDDEPMSTLLLPF
jgi:hypothetical protein